MPQDVLLHPGRPKETILFELSFSRFRSMALVIGRSCLLRGKKGPHFQVTWTGTGHVWPQLSGWWWWWWWWWWNHCNVIHFRCSTDSPPLFGGGASHLPRWRPTPIQAQVWPVAAKGSDIIGIAPWSSGKHGCCHGKNGSIQPTSTLGSTLWIERMATSSLSSGGFNLLMIQVSFLQHIFSGQSQFSVH